MFFLKKGLILLSLSLFLLVGSGIWAEPSLASIRQQEEAPGQILYQSRQSIQDNHGQTWQVVLFKRVKAGRVETVDLRLVAYPGQATFIHPGSLSLSVPNQAPLTAPDQFATEAPAPNVGQFDLKDILPQLPTDQKVQLSLPLKEQLTIEIPPEVLLEWRLMA
ncbi:hypothetical protein AWQ21_10985 [Picosynechococcus sp. PCC 7003]|uniref:DUF3122 domain-containing protein n=1 Tax=Picosynechococcus sp. PCC 7003 TaxID=374981 RepID=UPI000810B32A|nr:DUF3122 domain-containing protein [Picosynechococcus sp. PCC 7003]ANV84856.1 hypothetical protein AWQ21_10985 [Picosynechococcus sp. PCC 7003]